MKDSCDMPKMLTKVCVNRDLVYFALTFSRFVLSSNVINKDVGGFERKRGEMGRGNRRESASRERATLFQTRASRHYQKRVQRKMMTARSSTPGSFHLLWTPYLVSEGIENVDYDSPEKMYLAHTRKKKLMFNALRHPQELHI